MSGTNHQRRITRSSVLNSTPEDSAEVVRNTEIINYDPGGSTTSTSNRLEISPTSDLATSGSDSESEDKTLLPTSFNFNGNSLENGFFSRQNVNPVAAAGQSSSSVLSPRRSSRLLEKHANNFQTDEPNVPDFYFFTRNYLRQSDSTSDYGTSSLCSTTQRTNPEILLSDDLSNMSLEDFDNLTLKSVNWSRQSIGQLNYSILVPNSNQTAIVIPKPDLNTSVLNHFKNLNTNVLLLTDVFQISIENYIQNELFPAIVSVGLKNYTESFSIYKKESNNWLKIGSKELIDSKSVVSFQIEFSTNYVIVQNEIPFETSCEINVNKDTFKINSDPKIIVNFPKNCLNSVTKIQSKIYLNQLDSNAASPLIELTPHGIEFLKDVEIKIEILEYENICKQFNCNLILMESRDFIQWNCIHNFSVVNSVLVFNVRHFSYFKVVWDLISGTISSAKMGLSNLLNSNTFSMKCQSTMNEYENDRFGLEISVFRAEKSFPDVQNYSHVVGRSVSKLVKPGKLILALKSGLFGADTDAGEEIEMVKEISFFGEDFGVDFALKFNDGQRVSNGPFGKVLVKREITKSRKETVFEFNVQKQGNESENKSLIETSPNHWSIVALEELATSLFITDDENWKLFAQRIGFTKSEIKSQFKTSSDPFRAIIEAYKTRGGTPEEFIKSLYEVNRQLKADPLLFNSPNSMGSRSPSTHSSGLGSSMSKYNQNNKRYFDPHEMEDGHRSAGSSQITSDSLLSRPSKKRRQAALPPQTKSKIKLRSTKRRKLSPEFEPTTSSDESSSSQNQNQTYPKPRSTHSSNKSSNMSISLQNDLTKLDNSYTWALSEHLTTDKWKALGRSLKLEEHVLINIENTHKSTGFRECYYQVLCAWIEHFPKKANFGTLYTALVKENLVSAAKKMIEIRDNKEDS